MPQQLSDFWDLVEDVWRSGVAGVDLNRILIALGIIVLFLVLRGLFSRFVLNTMKRVSSRTETSLDDSVFEALQGPVKLVPVVLGLFIALNYLQLPERYALIADKGIRSLIAFAVFWGLYEITGPLSYMFRRLEQLLSREMVAWLIRFLHIAVVLIGGAAILEIWGIEVGAVLAGLGLFGVAVALGAQDLFKNLIAGILVIVEQRMKVGDWIRVDGVVEGIVENIGFRSTIVRQFDKAPVFVPNAKLSDNPVTNYSEMTHRRIKWIIGVEYRTTLEQLREIRDSIEAYILETEDFASPEEVATFVRIDSFNDSSIDILLYCFTRTIQWGEWLKIKEALAYRVKEVVEGAGTAFAFPSRSVYLETIPGEAAEVFVPPSS